MTILAGIYGDPTFSNPIQVLSVGSHPVRVLSIQSGLIRSDLGFVNARLEVSLKNSKRLMILLFSHDLAGEKHATNSYFL